MGAERGGAAGGRRLRQRAGARPGGGRGRGGLRLGTRRQDAGCARATLRAGRDGRRA